MRKYRITATKGKQGMIRWRVVHKHTGKTAALSNVNETYHSHAEAMRAGLVFAEGMQKRPPPNLKMLLIVATATGILLGIGLCRLGGL